MTGTAGEGRLTTARAGRATLNAPPLRPTPSDGAPAAPRRARDRALPAREEANARGPARLSPRPDELPVSTRSGEVRVGRCTWPASRAASSEIARAASHADIVQSLRPNAAPRTVGPAPPRSRRPPVAGARIGEIEVERAGAVRQLGGPPRACASGRSRSPANRRHVAGRQPARSSSPPHPGAGTFEGRGTVRSIPSFRRRAAADVHARAVSSYVPLTGAYRAARADIT